MSHNHNNPFLGYPPRKVSFLSKKSSSLLKKKVKILMYLISHTFSLYEEDVVVPEPITNDNPSGEIVQDQLYQIERIAKKAEERRYKLENKATIILSALGIITPAIIGIYFYAIKNIGASTFELTLFYIVTFLISGLIFGAFVAVLRALGVYKHEELGVYSIVDPTLRSIKSYTPDYYGRGLLYISSKREALNDHIADFVRASQMFTAFAILILFIGLMPLVNANIEHSNRNSTQHVATYDQLT